VASTATYLRRIVNASPAGVPSQEQWHVMATAAGDSNARAAIVHYVVDALVGASGSGQLQQSSKVRDGIDERIGQVRRCI